MGYGVSIWYVGGMH